MEERPGRPPHIPLFLWQSGDVFLPQPLREALDTPLFKIGGAQVEGWTGMHGLSGVAVKRAGFGPVAALAIHKAWELWQVYIGMAQLEPEYDDAVDTLAFMVGYAAS